LICQTLRGIDVGSLTPLEALNKIEELQRLTGQQPKSSKPRRKRRKKQPPSSDT
jgi:hypothetical protein